MNKHHTTAITYMEAITIAADDVEDRRLTMAAAQVEATLALAYEQRTANLIALAQMEHRNSAAVGFHEDYDSAAIHERLGLA